MADPTGWGEEWEGVNTLLTFQMSQRKHKETPVNNWSCPEKLDIDQWKRKQESFCVSISWSAWQTETHAQGPISELYK